MYSTKKAHTDMKYVTVDNVKKAVFNRPDDANKGTLGSLLSICGCYGMAGAAVMSGKSALRCGLGLLKTALPKSIYPIVATNISEGVYFPLSETDDGKLSRDNIDFILQEISKTKAVLIGCGLGISEDTRLIVNSVLEKCDKPMVFDADALNCICDNPDLLKKAKAPVIITPHPGEMARLMKATPKLVNADRVANALNFAQKYNVVTVLKGSGTVIASPDREVMINPTGNSGMATGGSGDVLAGIIGSLLAQGENAFDVACGGVYLHGLAGDIACEKHGKISMLPTDIIDCISVAFKKCGI